MYQPQYINDSLLITAELCESRASCQEGVAFIRKYFPDGFTVEDVYNRKVRHIPMSFLLDGYTRLPFSNKDKLLFTDRMNIRNSTNFSYCHDIEYCDNIMESSYCTDSKNIEYSSDVSNSQYVYHSTDIISSRKIYKSSIVHSSSYILNSENVTNSSFVKNSKEINESQVIVGSRKAKNSLWVIGGEDIERVLLSSNIQNTKNCIACVHQLNSHTPKIFNKEVSVNIFNRVAKVLEKELLQFYNSFLKNIDDFVDLPTSDLLFFKEMIKFPYFFDIIKEILPNYNADIMYQITLSEDAF